MLFEAKFDSIDEQLNPQRRNRENVSHCAAQPITSLNTRLASVIGLMTVQRN